MDPPEGESPALGVRIHYKVLDFWSVGLEVASHYKGCRDFWPVGCVEPEFTIRNGSTLPVLIVSQNRSRG